MWQLYDVEFKPFGRRRLSRQWLLQAATNNTAIKGENRFKGVGGRGAGSCIFVFWCSRSSQWFLSKLCGHPWKICKLRLAKYLEKCHIINWCAWNCDQAKLSRLFESRNPLIQAAVLCFVLGEWELLSLSQFSWTRHVTPCQRQRSRHSDAELNPAHFWLTKDREFWRTWSYFLPRMHQNLLF